MAPNLRSVHKLCARIFLCTALVSIQRVLAQTPCSDARPEIGLQSPRNTQEANGGFGENPKPELLNAAFQKFFMDLRWEERRVARDIAEGKNPPRPRTNWARILFITCDKQDALRAIGAEANAKLDEIESEAALGPPHNSANQLKEELAADKAFAEKILKGKSDIADEAIGKFREALGEQGFDNLEAYIYYTEGYAGVPGVGKPLQPAPVRTTTTVKEPQP